jgi:alpha-amylase
MLTFAGYAGDPEDVDYSVFNPFDNSKYYHSYCAMDADTNQTTVETCWLGDDTVALADLRTEDEAVRDMFGEWIRGLVSNYSIDGLRIDTAVNVEPKFYPDFLKAANVFATGETMDGDNSFVCEWADAIGSVLNYPVYYPLTRAFSSTTGNINDLTTTIHTNAINCNDPTAFGLFTENHDVERFPSMTNDTALAKNLLTFNIMGDGIPIIYQGQEQHMAGTTSPYTNRSPIWWSNYDTDTELYKQLATLIKLRQHMIASNEKYARETSNTIYQDYHSFAIRKGVEGSQVITLLTNNGASSGRYELDIKRHGYDEGTAMMDVLSCKELTVDDKGTLVVPMNKGLPKVMVPTDLLEGSGLCGAEESTTTHTPSSTGTSGSEPGPSETGCAHGQYVSYCFPILVALLSTVVIQFAIMD